MDTIWLVLALPLLGALICATHYRSLGKTPTGIVACVAILGAFLASVHQAVLVAQTGGGPLLPRLGAWLVLPGVAGLNFGAYVDPLTAIMLCTVTGVAFLIHCYSMGYMADEPEYGRFFASMNLFVATMVLLVIADNLPLLLVGWGGVGFASYNLIGFYRSRPSAVSAARKAFLINVVGDVALMIAIFLLASKVGAVDYQTLFLPGSFDRLGGDVLTVGLLLLIGAYAKSAQLPLHAWLPDAMEGPTPVSALIHAATMVTAGVYLVARFHPLFDHPMAKETLLPIIAIAGAATALVAAMCAIVQNDLKRILAYSTMSQLGYMFMSCGVGAYGAAIFHLVTHAFFKALLFLTAGVVIHALHGEQDIRRMGGLGKKLPGAQYAFLLGGLALAGVPPLAGFWSKEAILASTWEGTLPEAQALWAVGILTALLTAYYTGRAYWLVFWAPAHEEERPVHLSGSSMGWPLAVLAVLTVAAGFAATSFNNYLALAAGAHPHGLDWTQLTAIGVGVIGIVGAWHLHKQGRPTAVPDGAATVLRGAEHIDTLGLYAARSFRRVADVFAVRIDPVPSQLAPDLLRRSMLSTSELLCQLQGGSLRLYALAVLASAALLTVFVFVLAHWMNVGATSL